MFSLKHKCISPTLKERYFTKRNTLSPELIQPFSTFTPVIKSRKTGADPTFGCVKRSDVTSIEWKNMKMVFKDSSEHLYSF
jgi:hypothetical protein